MTSKLVWNDPKQTLSIMRAYNDYGLPQDLELFDNNKLLDFKGQTLLSLSFDHKPFVSAQFDQDINATKFGGFETEIVRIVANALNMKINIRDPPSKVKNRIFAM